MTENKQNLLFTNRNVCSIPPRMGKSVMTSSDSIQRLIEDVEGVVVVTDELNKKELKGAKLR